ncbi:hypothetical protein ARGLB_035_00420 [Arthrobacter globiformis NBRC 12137]|uniref:Lipoprotein n=1 Tax=Arthrobacter globiformis (strain ATCC 8010 / DSM 20124 / JCM 1332 / NBRC 12137 / NCIMB 8907 / NRRL B-2979 / 168) TaxID=1077972 RepID=H0QJS6_ARTG1|nr:hypothetical protein [Arthrobacter globiformis]GAB13077.1 hypothetical protein ARGLB_035_00420 [Arthrobacter globiformis NBRC 12137]
MKRIFTAAVIGAVAGLTACASTPKEPIGPSSIPTETAVTTQPSPSESSPTSTTGSVKEACETFNALYAEYEALSGTDPNAYEDIYLKAQDAKDTVSGDLTGLFASLSALSMDHSAAAENGGQPEQASKDAVRDAVFANAGTCTAEGVTLRL